MKIIQLDIDESQNIGVDAISLVDYPAVEIDFLCFDKTKNIKPNKFVFALGDSEKHIITGPALIPDKFILRYDAEIAEMYYIYFSKNTVERISQQYLKQEYNANVNVNHETLVNDVCLVESWIVSDPKNDKANALGFDLPVGTWMVSMKVDNEDVWQNLIKKGYVKGFSIEGYFISLLSKNDNMK